MRAWSEIRNVESSLTINGVALVLCIPVWAVLKLPPSSSLCVCVERISRLDSIVTTLISDLQVSKNGISSQFFIWGLSKSIRDGHAHHVASVLIATLSARTTQGNKKQHAWRADGGEERARRRWDRRRSTELIIFTTEAEPPLCFFRPYTDQSTPTPPSLRRQCASLPSPPARKPSSPAATSGLHPSTTTLSPPISSSSAMSSRSSRVPPTSPT